MIGDSGKELDGIDKVHKISSMYKLTSSSKDSDDLSTGSHKSIEAGERQMTNIKTARGNYEIEMHLKNVLVLQTIQKMLHMGWAQCIIGSEEDPDAGINCNYAVNIYSQAYGENVSCFRYLAKNDNSQPYITQKDFITSNEYPENDRPEYKSNVSDNR